MKRRILAWLEKHTVWFGGLQSLTYPATPFYYKSVYWVMEKIIDLGIACNYHIFTRLPNESEYRIVSANPEEFFDELILNFKETHVGHISGFIEICRNHTPLFIVDVNATPKSKHEDGFIQLTIFEVDSTGKKTVIESKHCYSGYSDCCQLMFSEERLRYLIADMFAVLIEHIKYGNECTALIKA